MSGFFSNQDPKLRPLWVRLSIVAAIAVWAAVEVYLGLEIWSFIAGMALMYCVWTLLLNYSPPPEDENDE